MMEIKLNRNRLIIVILVITVIFWMFYTKEIKQETQTNAIPVTTIKTITKPLEVTESTVGSLSSLMFPEIKAETGGRVVKLFVDVGQSVQQGQILAELDPTDQSYSAAANSARIEELIAQEHNASLTTARYQKLLKSRNLSQADYDKAIANLNAIRAQLGAAKAQTAQAKYQLARTRIIAPISGRIQSRNISIGDFITTGMPLFQVVDLSRLRATLPFPETMAQSLSVGMPVRLHTPGVNTGVVSTNIIQLSPMIESSNRSFNVIVDFANQYHWRPGGSVEAEVIVSHNPKAVMVPLECVVNRPNGTVVYKIENNKAIERKVTTGFVKDNWIEIKKGLQPNEIIAQDGAGYLSNGASISLRNGI